MSVLDTIDTTVTLEWAETRTVATLVRLGARVATVTALRTPEPGHECFLRLEGDGPGDTIALDGTCVATRDGEWGEYEVDVTIARVGTTTSATALRDFIEQHAIAKGGTVAVGKNRDNPEIKRFVYTLPHTGARVDAPVTRASAPRPVQMPTSSLGESQPLQPIRGADPVSAPVSSFAPRLPSAPHEPTGPVMVPRGAAALEPVVDSVDAELQAMLDLLDQRAGRGVAAADSLPESEPIARPDAGRGPQTVQDFLPPMLTPSGGLEDDGPILVETVELSDSQPRPVLTVPQAKVAGKKGLVARLFGFGDKDRGEPHAAETAIQSSQDYDDEPQVDPLAVWDKPVRAQQSGRGQVSGSLQAVQQLFTVDHAVRTEKPVTFESGKKKRQGTVLRLSESKVRVRSAVMPALYERIAITLPAPRGGKELVVIRCEVTRVRQAESEGGEQSFDAKLTGANDPMTMARLRQLMSEMQPAMGDGL